ncbi:sugar diacid recognition domain-containing protein [soil metagenome]
MLDPDLAQQIVDLTMEKLGHNVNVMDERGVIVGSGDADRLGEVHEGAVLAISGRRVGTVDAAACRHLEGVRPGINVPLVHRGQVVGAIGVTGDPDQLGEISALLTMTAELILEQVRVLDDDQWRRRRRESLARSLVDPASAAEAVAIEARRLDVDLSLPRVAVLVDVGETDGDGDGGRRLRDVQRSLERGDASVLSVATGPSLLLVLVSPLMGGAADRVLALLGALGRQVVLHEGGSFTAEAGEPVRPEARSAQSAADVRRLAAGRPEGVHRYGDDSTAALLAGLADDWRLRELCAPWRQLREQDPHGVLAETVIALLAAGGDLTETAHRLRVHRNTLRYRLDRVTALTGVDPRDPEGALRLQVGAARDVVQAHNEFR